MAYREITVPGGKLTTYAVPTLPIVVNKAVQRSEMRRLVTNAEFSSHENYIANSIVHSLRMFLLGDGKTETVSIPKTYVKKVKVVADGDPVPTSWWQMLKRDYFPEWFKQRWPVKTVTPHYEQEKEVTFESVQTIQHTTNRICPHNDVVFPDKKHFDFVTFDVEEP